MRERGAPRRAAAAGRGAEKHDDGRTAAIARGGAAAVPIDLRDLARCEDWRSIVDSLEMSDADRHQLKVDIVRIRTFGATAAGIANARRRAAQGRRT